MQHIDNNIIILIDLLGYMAKITFFYKIFPNFTYDFFLCAV